MFNNGQVVQLKSGGPAMTVKGGNGTSSVTCVFFDGQGEADEMTVPEACLQEYVEKKEDKPIKRMARRK